MIPTLKIVTKFLFHLFFYLLSLLFFSQVSLSFIADNRAFNLVLYCITKNKGLIK